MKNSGLPNQKIIGHEHGTLNNLTLLNHCGYG